MRILVVTLAIVAVFLSLVMADYLVYGGRVHPGVEVAGLSLSGRQEDEATAMLEELAADLAAQPIGFSYEGRTFEATAGEFGWQPDIPATVEEALDATGGGSPFVDAWNRIRAWVRSISVPWVADFGDGYAAVVAGWSETVAREPVEGRVWVEGETVMTEDPVSGIQIDALQVQAMAVDVLAGRSDGTQPLPVIEVPAQTTPSDVDAAAADATRLLAGPINGQIGTIDVRFQPKELAPLVESTVEPVVGAGGEVDSTSLVLTLDPDGVRKLLKPYRRRVEKKAISAEFVPHGKTVRIRRSRPGRQIDPELAARRLVAISAQPDRSGKIPMTPVDPPLTTEEAEELGINEQVSGFTTYHACCEPRVTNIHLGADNLEGAIVMPGETFSLNERLGQRTPDKGYVLAPGINSGVLVETYGGGISQLTTTLFNAAFFGGYPIPEWQAHSFYFTRYPLGREATLSWPAPDLKFVNDTRHALLISTSYTDVSITVKIYSTKVRQVTATDPVITYRTATGYGTLVERIIRRGGQEIRRDRFETFYKNGVPLTEEEAQQQEEESSPSPSPNPTPSESPSG
jgi:vancomycin resistance protein YoaR